MSRPAAADDIDHLFADGGETGALMHGQDWTNSELGPVSSWPRSLKTCVRIILTSRQPMFVWWGPRLINLYNDAYRDIVGGKHPHALGRPASEVWREIWDQVGPRAMSTMSTNRGTYDEALLLIMHRHGYEEETYYTFSYSPVPDDDGSIGGIICANTDETQRIVNERRLALLRELAARSSQTRTWRQACSESAAALATETKDVTFSLIYMADQPNGKVDLASPAPQLAGGFIPPESIAWGARDPWRVMPALATRQIQVVTATSSEGLPTGGWLVPPRQVAAVPIPPSGETGHAGVLVVGLNPFQPFDARYRDFLTLLAAQVGAGIANAHAYEEERRRAEALAELDRAKTAFFSNVSHEFRTPLTLMLAPVEDSLSDADQPLPPVHRERLELIHRNAQRLLKLVNNLLDFSRIQAGRIRAAFEPVDLSALTADLASTFRSAIERAGLALQIECPPLGEPVYVDRDMWEQVVLNLLSNAFKHTFAGTITVSVRRQGDRAELRVSDTGVGIASEELPRIFQRFHRVLGARSRSHEGTGIGLALVRELVTLHGGTIQVESEVDRGSTFTATARLGRAHLPREQIHESPGGEARRAAAAYVDEAQRWLPEREPADHDLPAPPPGPASGRILLADDNADMRSYVQRLLSPHWAVEAVGDGAAALAAVRRQPPELVLSDVMMPQLDGLGLVRAIRADAQIQHIPIILLSARAGGEANVEGLATGADDYLTKPFSAQELVARVKAHIQLKRQRDEAARLVREKERLLRIVTDDARVGLVMVDRQHRYLVANPTYAGLIGQESGALVGRSMEEVGGVHRHIGPFIARAFTGARVQCEFRLAPGEMGPRERWFSASFTLSEDAVAGPCVIVAILDVSDRKRVEEDLHDSQRTLLLALQSARTAAWTWDPRVNELSSSVNLASLCGLAPDRPPAMDKIRGLIHAEDLPAREAAVERSLRERIPYRAAYRLRRPADGRRIWLEEAGEAFTEAESTCLRGVTVDVTERMEALAALRRSEERFRSIVDQSLAGIAESDATGRFTTVNDRFCSMTGYSQEALLLMSKRELTHPEDRARNSALIARLEAEGTAFEIEKRYLRKDGSEIWVHNSVSGVRDAAGKLLRMITVSIDITDRKRIERTLRYRTEQYATLFNQAPIGAFVVDADFRISDMNPTARPAFAALGREAIGLDFGEVVRRIRPPDYAEEQVARFRRTLQMGEPHEVAESRAYPGVKMRHQWRIDRITMPDGRYGVVCYFRDVTRQIAAREALASYAEDLRKANVELEHFASIASHDLQEPLRMISSYTDIMLRRYGASFDERGREYCERIRGGAERMRSLIRALHVYAQVGKQETRPVEVSLDAIVADALDNLREQLRSCGAEVLAGKLPTVQGDPSRLLQLFQNLIANAVKFTPRDRAPVVRIDARDEGESWRIAIADNGIGIPEGGRTRIFQIFQRLNPTEEYPGSGIGLATCKKIVEQHGGQIGVESEVGCGSTFWFTFPKPTL